MSFALKRKNDTNCVILDEINEISFKKSVLNHKNLGNKNLNFKIYSSKSSKL